MNKRTKMVYDNTFPAYAQTGYDSFFLLRFFDTEEHRQAFIDGNLYMRTQTDFTNDELGIGRSDFTEGADLLVIPHNQETYPDVRFVEENGNCFIKVIEYSDKPEGYKRQPLFISYPVKNQRRNLFCMYTLWCNSENNTCMSLDAVNMNNFGEYGVIIIDRVEFFNRIAVAANKEKTIQNLKCGFVNYITDENLKNVMMMNPFIKPASKYSYQNEFRFCADTDNTSLLELKLERSLEDIVYPINLKNFAKTVSFKDGKLLFLGEKREKHDDL